MCLLVLHFDLATETPIFRAGCDLTFALNMKTYACKDGASLVRRQGLWHPSASVHSTNSAHTDFHSVSLWLKGLSK